MTKHQPQLISRRAVLRGAGAVSAAAAAEVAGGSNRRAASGDPTGSICHRTACL